MSWLTKNKLWHVFKSFLYATALLASTLFVIGLPLLAGRTLGVLWGIISLAAVIVILLTVAIEYGGD